MTCPRARGRCGRSHARRDEGAVRAAPVRADGARADDGVVGAAVVGARGRGAAEGPGPGCEINLYGGLLFPNYYFSLVADMPAFCGCSFAMRKYPTSPHEDILPHSVLVIGNDMHEMEFLDAAVVPVLTILRRMLQVCACACAGHALSARARVHACAHAHAHAPAQHARTRVLHVCTQAPRTQVRALALQ